MSDTTSTMNPPTTDQIKALQIMEKSIRNLLSSFGVDGTMAAASSTKKGRGRTKKDATSDGAPVVDKPKREINPKIAEMNVERKVIYGEMLAAWKSANPEYAEMAKPDLTKAIADGKVSKPPSYPDALKEHSKRLNERDPERAARKSKAKSDDASSTKSAAKTAAAAVATTVTDSTSTGTGDAPAKKRRGPKPLSEMTTEERAAHDAKVAAKKAAKSGTAAPAATSVSSPVAPLPPAPTKTAQPEVITGDDDDPETLKPWSFEDTKYFKNDLGYVYEMSAPDEPGDYVGRYTVKKGRKYIDASAPEPDNA